MQPASGAVSGGVIMKLFILVTTIICSICNASPVWLGGDVTFQSKYIWRGAVINDKPVIQPWIASGIGNAAVTIWGSLDLTDQNTYLENSEVQDPSGKFTEIDLILNYSGNIGPTCLTAGYNKYWYPNSPYSETSASEATLSACYDAFLYPTLTTAFSMGDAEGVYMALTLSHSERISELASADISVNLGYGDEKHNGYYYGAAQGGLADLTVNLSVPFVLPSNFTIAPIIEYASLLDSEVRDAFDNPSNFRGGVSLTRYFL